MSRIVVRRSRRAVRLLLAVLAAALAVAIVPSGSASSDTPRAVADGGPASYTCQYTGLETSLIPSFDGLPLLGGLPLPVLPALGGSDEVAVEVDIDAPTSIAAGEALRLRGTARFTFGANATATNAATRFSFISDSFGLEVAAGSYRRFLRIERLVTSESSVGSSTVTARWRLPDFLVPSTASTLTFSLPHEAVATNPVSTTPRSVAFTGILRTDSRLQAERATACAARGDDAARVASVRVTGAPTSEPTPDGGTSEGDGGPGLDSPTGAPSVTDGGTSLPPAPPGATIPETGTATPAPTQAAPALVSAQPIPAETVPRGVTLPAWGAVLLGAFVAGGLFLGLSSHRRLRRAGAVAGALAPLVALPTPFTPSPPAHAATGQAQVTLVCVYEAEGSNPNDVPKNQPTGLAISLQVPDSVAPGDVVTLTGSASVQAPEDIRSQGSALGFNTLDAISDSFSVGMTVGSGKRQVLLADRWQTGKTAFGNPLVVRAPLYFPAFKVPEDASGAITLELPRNEVVDRRPAPYRNANTPPRVAVEFLASASGNGTSITYVVSCWRSDTGSGRIASIPVTSSSGGGPSSPAAPSGTPSSTTAPAPGVVPEPTPGSTAGPVIGGTPSAAPSQEPGAVPSGAPTSAVTVAPGTTAAPSSTAVVALPMSAPPTDRVVIPGWLLAVSLLVAGGGYGLAGWNRLRLRSRRA
ncbi:hypothetical protein [Nocardioides sp. R-C-SC26]|uniref:hypothetical protein n=1 Tax=Nocardioides sp. R-C-SC26 TaxID=2870414 RepID=UPI001E2D6537|nr:hypothetical protein [Nocardioides sp. R-C-SC26]